MKEYLLALQKEIQNIINSNKLSIVEYIGINISSDFQRKFKIYYLDKLDVNQIYLSSDELFLAIKELSKKKIIGRISRVDDFGKDVHRYEMCVNKRCGLDYRYMINVLSSASILIKNRKEEIDYLSKMTFDTNSALYFLGFVDENRSINSIKLHYMARDTNKNISSDHYMKYIFNSGIPSFCLLSTIIKKFIEMDYGTLYICGVDYFFDGSAKYKIYMQVNNPSLTHFFDTFYKSTHFNWLRNDIISIQEFLTQFSVIKLKGFALCCDTQNIYTINLYFGLNSTLCSESCNVL